MDVGKRVRLRQEIAAAVRAGESLVEIVNRYKLRTTPLRAKWLLKYGRNQGALQ